ncbi:polysaccharide lyase [Dyadobacter psychrophilus]|uniref:polysaccharide lyase n=1 Tax=Dyadobacter psychrophilus TaxID=651661 RepID=UPI001482D9F2|nr:polysaccharide lyase [Dyadobacter psychrophilus]
MSARNAGSFAEDLKPIIRYNFDTEIGSWYENSTCCPWSLSLNSLVARAGSGSIKFDLRREDNIQNPRTELGREPNNNQESWYGFSLFFPASFIKDPIEESIVQWNSRPDLKEGESWRSAPLFLGILNDRFVLEVRSDSNRITKQGYFSFNRLDLGPVEKETWHDWVFHIKWAYDNTGVIEVWKNGQLILSRLNQPNSYNDAMFPYFKVGIYKWDWATKATVGIDRRTMFVDEISIGNHTADFKQVSPQATPLPVTLASFTAAKLGLVSQLKWSTAQEVNAERFVIQRSSNAKNWQNVGEKMAIGASSNLINYAFTDQKPVKGTSYYRLKIVDKDQTFAYSSIKSLKF